jgi:ribosomal protein S20
MEDAKEWNKWKNIDVEDMGAAQRKRFEELNKKKKRHEKILSLEKDAVKTFKKIIATPDKYSNTEIQEKVNKIIEKYHKDIGN